MADEKNPGAGKSDASTKSGDDLVLVKVARKHLKISDKELDDISGGRASSGYGTLDYTTGTCHGGD